MLTRQVDSQAHPLFGAYGIAADRLRGLAYFTMVDGAFVLTGDTLRATARMPSAGRCLPVVEC